MKAIIIGAGIGGLGLSIALKREGIDAELYEKAPVLTEAGAAISLFPNALHVLKSYGLLDEILKKSGAFDTVHVKNAKGTSLSSVSPNYELPSVCIHRADLQKVLLDTVDPAIIHCGETFVKFEEDKDGITAFFESGRQVKADLLIGADGLRSHVRNQVIGDDEPVYRGYTCWRGVARLESKDLPAGYGSESNGLGKRVGIVPIGDGRYGWWATNNEPENTPDGPDRKQHLLHLFGNWHFPIRELIQNTEEILKNDIYDRIPVRGWSKGRAVLLGDAAHPTTPNLGQGGCMALEDGPILAKCLAKYGSLKIAFDRYETLRFERTKAITAQSLLHGKLGQLSSPVGAAIRDFSFRLIPARLAMKTLDRFFGYKADEVKC